MGKDSKIEWTRHTFNPWWGCVKIGIGCQHCYAERYAARYGYDVWGPDKGRRLFGDKHWAEPIKWNAEAEKAGERQRVFCGSMCDVFENHYITEWAEKLEEQRQRLWDLIAETPWLTWMLLTKRPYNVWSMTPGSWYYDGWPDNVWLGISASIQSELGACWLSLRLIPARVRFFSLEPLLEPIDVSPYIVDWVIVGAESGPRARWMDPEWARGIREMCRIAEVPFFMKQMSGRAPIPEDLLIREFPDDG